MGWRARIRVHGGHGPIRCRFRLGSSGPCGNGYLVNSLTGRPFALGRIMARDLVVDTPFSSWGLRRPVRVGAIGRCVGHLPLRIPHRDMSNLAAGIALARILWAGWWPGCTAMCSSRSFGPAQTRTLWSFVTRLATLMACEGCGEPHGVMRGRPTRRRRSTGRRGPLGPHSDHP
jgi:hypothetical protein